MGAVSCSHAYCGRNSAVWGWGVFLPVGHAGFEEKDWLALRGASFFFFFVLYLLNIQ